ncbi:Gag polyprotein [Bienertia sinuspersici]
MGEIKASESNEKICLMLIGKLLIERLVNIEAFKSTMTKAWALIGRIIIRDELCLGKFRRAKVVLDVTKPLRRFQRIKNKDGRVIKVDYKYERLPFFCFNCGVIGHSEKDCLGSEDEGSNGEYGWGCG